MANKHRAEVEVKGADGSSYVFRLGSGAICQLEESLNMEIMAIFSQIQEKTIRLTTVREFTKASCISAKDMTNEQANDLIDDVGVMPLLDAMTDSIIATFNIPKKDENKANGAGNPPKPAKARRGGAGTSSAQPVSAS